MSQAASRLRGEDSALLKGVPHRPFYAAAQEHNLSINKPLFISPLPAGRKITAGFSFVQRIGKSASIDVWFPEILRQELNKLISKGSKLGPQNFPAEWAAVRQFELLQEAGNYKIYDMEATYLTRSLMELTKSMRGGGYRVTVATLGGYVWENDKDDLEILDRRLQDRISRLIHMLYLEEQSEGINRTNDAMLAAEKWNYQTALPHVGVTLGARDLFRPVDGVTYKIKENVTLPENPNPLSVTHTPSWVDDEGVFDAETNQPLNRVKSKPAQNQYAVDNGIYRFASTDAGRELIISYSYSASRSGKPKKIEASELKHKFAQQFFDILSLLPQNHIVHDTAVGLQLPESINENEWIYLAPEDKTFACFNRLLTDLFKPFDGMSLSKLDGREDAKSEIKSASQHMRGYGDRLTPESEQFYRNLAQYSLQ